MEKVIGQRQELSFYDVKLANIAYCSGDVREMCFLDFFQINLLWFKFINIKINIIINIANKKKQMKYFF